MAALKEELEQLKSKIATGGTPSGWVGFEAARPNFAESRPATVSIEV